jgi:hypothetical protein
MTMKDKITITYELTIRPDYQSMIGAVAKMNGWDGDGDPKDFMVPFLNVYIGRAMKRLIRTTLDDFYGKSQASLIEQAMTDYVDSSSTDSVWSQVEE